MTSCFDVSPQALSPKSFLVMFGTKTVTDLDAGVGYPKLFYHIAILNHNIIYIYMVIDLKVLMYNIT